MVQQVAVFNNFMRIPACLKQHYPGKDIEYNIFSRNTVRYPANKITCSNWIGRHTRCDWHRKDAVCWYFMEFSSIRPACLYSIVPHDMVLWPTAPVNNFSTAHLNGALFFLVCFFRMKNCLLCLCVFATYHTEGKKSFFFCVFLYGLPQIDNCLYVTIIILMPFLSFVCFFVRNNVGCFSVSGCIVSLNWLLHAICYYLQELHSVDVIVRVCLFAMFAKN